MDKEKDPEEDFKLIDLNYGKRMELIKTEIDSWRSLGDDKAAIERHFDEVFAKFKELREYIANYSYIIPPYNLQNYQTSLDQVGDKINKEKEAALPKKKFTFARKQPAVKV